MLCTSSDEKVDQRLPKDLDLLEKYSSQMFLYILTDVYREFKANMVNNSEVLRIVVCCIDAKNLRDLIYQVTQGKLTIFKNDGVIDVIRDSLQYETFEQFCVWQLVQAHDVPIDFLQVNTYNRIEMNLFYLYNNFRTFSQKWNQPIMKHIHTCCSC